MTNFPFEFEFPFPPYEIQKEFMQKLYDTIEHGKIGIFESPTGTVPCASWLDTTGLLTL